MKRGKGVKGKRGKREKGKSQCGKEVKRQRGKKGKKQKEKKAKKEKGGKGDKQGTGGDWRGGETACNNRDMTPWLHRLDSWTQSRSRPPGREVSVQKISW